MAHVYIVYNYNDKLIQNAPSVIQVEQEDLRPFKPTCPAPGGRKMSLISWWKLEKLWARTVKKWKRQVFLIKNHNKIDGKFSRQRCLDPDPDPVCPESLDPNPVNVRPNPKTCLWPTTYKMSGFKTNIVDLHIFDWSSSQGSGSNLSGQTGSGSGFRHLCLENSPSILWWVLIRNCCLFHFLTVLSHKF